VQVLSLEERQAATKAILDAAFGPEEEGEPEGETTAATSEKGRSDPLTGRGPA
jgi:hypothetical protein